MVELTELDRFPIEALVALVERETVIIDGDFRIYGQFQYDPHTPPYQELYKRFGNAEASSKPLKERL